MSETNEAVVELTVVALIGAPIWAWLLWRKLRTGSFLPYTRRWPAPWGPIGAFLALGFLLLAFLEAGVSSGPVDQLTQREPVTSTQFMEMTVISSVLNLLFVAAICIYFHRGRGASWEDLGLPTSGGVLLQDLGVGVLTAFASLLPIYLLQAALVFGVGIKSEHPTLLMLLQESNPLVLAVAWFGAGLVAPVFEEFVFRLLFQGWMERVEDEALGVAGKLELEGDAEGDGDLEIEERLEQVQPDDENPFSSPQIHTLRRLRRRRGAPPTPPQETVAGLPHGWGPVMISSFVFALVHISQGAAIGPLFLFALMLGYLYQRTHRITPSIFAHMTFNTISLAAAYASAHLG
ncbi:CAAX amino terminal protease self- immunity [Posidoniimonas polymericola]|uniref:CAAX amino terminal protease self-immunity n=1 Tax=Posidoniimonas polymericola TaxID=2528002 RepID=A0A5C5XXJ1_9BACT|nr:CPBP family intramembrane glutamic endopeptidase [Posidoniimonas polymericola]TWT67594.1 CAAX amino terminal protease self- immunity [Posidoniimonas polymericola]